MRSHTRVYVAAAVVLLALCTLASVAEATNIPNGAWQIIGNSFFGTLQINSIDGAGNMNVSAYGNTTTGFYNNVSNTIEFLRQTGGALDTVQHYSGALMVLPAGGGVCTYVLTGTFSAYSGTGATASRPNFAWAAFINGAC